MFNRLIWDLLVLNRREKMNRRMAEMVMDVDDHGNQAPEPMTDDNMEQAPTGNNYNSSSRYSKERIQEMKSRRRIR